MLCNCKIRINQFWTEKIKKNRVVIGTFIWEISTPSQKEQHKAEILWALKCVMSHFSFNSSTDITDMFKAMFPGSSIAQNMKFWPNKLSYLICFDTATFFKQQLLGGTESNTMFCHLIQ